MSPRLKKVLFYLPAFLWMSFIFFLSSRSTIGIGTTRTERFLILKTFHLIEYATLYFLFFIANSSTKKSASFAYLYALSDELHQSFVPGREGKFVDTLIDLLGITIAILLTPLILKTLKSFNIHLPFAKENKKT